LKVLAQQSKHFLKALRSAVEVPDQSWRCSAAARDRLSDRARVEAHDGGRSSTITEA
jgi:hypothetical protein